MAWLLFLILFPLLPAVLFLIVKNNSGRSALVYGSSLLLALASLGLAWQVWSGEAGLRLYAQPAAWAEHLILELEALLYMVLIWRALLVPRYGFGLAALLLAQAGLQGWLELSGRLAPAAMPLSVDGLSALMLAVVGIVGGLVAAFAVPYMAEHQRLHAHGPDKRGAFFAAFFLFFSAMYGILLCNSLTWLFLFWELSTLCSYLLIRHEDDETSRANSDTALGLNVIGGAFFLGAMAVLPLVLGTSDVQIDQLLAGGHAMLLPAALLGLAALVKAAQFPFQKWLLGAMVAPTPVSALLHSSTMVKAGIFLLLRFSPIYRETTVGLALAGVGALSFLTASILAVGESNAKRVLAWSTIANLGLMAACAGVATPEALWAGMLLIVFHAVAKSLLFLSVGSAELRLGSRDIEDMGGLLQTQKLLGAAMLIGILGMFLAPFGMLIAKWKVLTAFADAQPLLALAVAFGSAPTLFFWGKWMGQLVAAPSGASSGGPPTGGAVLLALSGLVVLAAAAFPWLSTAWIEPHVRQLFGQAPHFGAAESGALMALGVLAVALPLAGWLFPSKEAPSKPYLAGAEVEGGFTNAFHQPQAAQLRHYYLREVIPSAALGLGSAWLAAGLMLAALLLGAKP